MLKRKCTLTAVLLTLTSFAYASQPKILTNEDLLWKRLPKHPTLQYTVLSGNPLKNEWFTVRLKFPANYKDVIHVHDANRYDTIISGTYYFKFGDKLDDAQAQKLAAGDFIECPAHIKHYGYTNEETVVQIAGMGPWEVLKSTGMHR